jgi:outer membrane protein TolC
MRKWIWAAALIAAFVAFQKRASAQELKLDEFLLQVRGNHPGFKAARDAMQGAEMRLNEGNLIFMPMFELSATHEQDQKDYTNDDFNGTNSKSDLYEAAISQATPIGLTAKFGYTFLRRDVEGTNPLFQQPTSYTGAPMVELNLPLWRNGLGTEFRATRDKIKALQKATYYAERLKYESIALEAEATYSGLYFARQSTIARRDSLELSKKLLDWMSKRAVNELADDNDLNQARAAAEARELELLKAQNDERKAARAFNSLRGIASDVVEEKLSYTMPLIDLAKKNVNLANDKVRAAEKQKEMVKADMQLALESHRPTLEVFGRYSYNSRESSSDEAMSESWQSDNPYQAFGVRFKTPIMFWETNKVNDGYRRSLAAADLELKRLYEENTRDLNDLYANIETSQKLVSLSQRLVDTQKKKLEKERLRHRRGRTTLFQVLQYEQEYVQTQLAQLGYQADLISLTNQLRLYRSE